MRDGGEDAALEMLRQPSATSECDDETPELNVEEPAPPRAPIPRRLCRAALACVPSVLPARRAAPRLPRPRIP